LWEKAKKRDRKAETATNQVQQGGRGRGRVGTTILVIREWRVRKHVKKEDKVTKRTCRQREPVSKKKGGRVFGGGIGIKVTAADTTLEWKYVKMALT